MKLNALYHAAVALLFLSLGAFAASTEVAKITASGGSPIPNAFSNSDSQSLVLTGMPRSINAISIISTVAEVLAFNVETKFTSDTPSVVTFYVPANGSLVFDKFPVNANVYMKSDGAAQTSGVVRIVAWARGD